LSAGKIILIQVIPDRIDLSKEPIVFFKGLITTGSICRVPGGNIEIALYAHRGLDRGLGRETTGNNQ
jgi:hypothetical protein